MYRIFRIKAYEAKHGPHFNEEYARKAVKLMENEDGSNGPHWTMEETSALANQHGIQFSDKFNRYDWFVAVNMIYSDYYKVIASITNSVSAKAFVDFAKAWLTDKDADEGKMWYYFIYIMCDKIRDAEMDCYERQHEEDEDDDDDYMPKRKRARMAMNKSRYRDEDYDYDDENRDDRNEYRRNGERRTSVRYIRY